MVLTPVVLDFDGDSQLEVIANEGGLDCFPGHKGAGLSRVELYLQVHQSVLFGPVEYFG